MIKIILYFKENESLYNPEMLYLEIDKIKILKNRTTLTVALDNLKDFYSRYQKSVHEFRKDIIVVMKSQ